MLTNTFNAIVKSNFSIFWLILRSYIMRYVIVINLAALFQSEYVFIIHIFKNHLRIVKKFLHLNLKFNRLDRYILFYTHQMPSHIIFDTILVDHKMPKRDFWIIVSNFWEKFSLYDSLFFWNPAIHEKIWQQKKDLSLRSF